ncbi:MAG: DUF4199 domain-containing protein [Bacteroidia bacterium]|nr:DUF4199 domain-containing protein [Bacteroidia bacterium]
MENEKTPVWKSAMNYGAIIGVVFVIYTLVIYLFNIYPTSFLSGGLMTLVNIVLLVLGLVYSTKHYRTHMLGGKISYAQSLLFGTLICLFSSIITGFFSYLLNAVIDPEYQVRMAKAIQDSMVEYMTNMGVSDSQIQDAIDKMNGKMPSALSSGFNMVLWGTIGGFIVSLITSAFLKKEGDPFADLDQAENI